MERLARAICNHPWIVLGLVALLSVPFALFATRARIDSSPETLVDPNDPETRFYEEAKQLFGSEEVDVVAIVADDVFRRETLEKVRTLSERLKKVRGVGDVLSLSTVESIVSGPEGAVEVAPVMDTVPATPEAIAALKARVLADPLLAGNVVSDDGQAAAILLRYTEMSDAEFAASGIHAEVERIAHEVGGPERVYVTGIPTIKATAAHVMRRDVLTFTPLTTLVIVGVLLLSFRTLRGVLLPIATTGLGLLWTVGLMAAFDVPIDIATVVIPSLLTAVGSAYATHVVASYYEEIEHGGDARTVAFRILRHMGVPVFVTALTTVLGFASLIVYRIAAIRNLGIFSTFGIGVLFALALTFVVAVLAVLPLRRPRTAVGGEMGWLPRVLEAIVRFDMEHRALVLGAGIAILAVSLWGVRYMRVDTNYLGYFPPESEVRQASAEVGRHFGGAVNFLVVVDGPKGAESSITRLDTLQRMAALQDFITRIPGVVKTTSLVDYVRLLHRAFHDGDPEYFTLPDTDRAVPQYLLLLGPEAVRHVVNGDYSRGAILVRSNLHSSNEFTAALQKIQRFGAAAFPAGFSVHPTGTVALLNRTTDSLTRGQLQSVLIALTVVFVTLSVFFVSVRLGLVALIPNVVPIVLFFGILGWADIPLSISTAVIASIALGMGVDEAIHLLTEFNHYVRQHADQRRAVFEAMRTVGPPVVYATVALTLGFLVPVFSGFLPVRQFGYLSAVNVGTSLLADLFLLPALVASVRFVTLWDILRVRLGHAPHETIPLFHGLRPSQARIAALLGQLRSIAAGDCVVRQGEASDAMYVILAGRAEVRAAGHGRALTVGTMSRGDVIGELGLLRGEKRTADVVALEPTEVLVVTERFLRVLRRRYPRIAATVLMNLTRMLSDRVQRTTDQLLDVAGAPAQLSGRALPS